MENLTGIKQPAWGAPTQPEYGEGTRSGVSAGYYTFTYQQLFPSAKTIWWAAGLSFLHRTLAETFFSFSRKNEEGIPQEIGLLSGY